jgi:predicted ArsR family transcriptional regulator
VDVREPARPDPGTAPELGESRTRVLAALRATGAPLAVGAVADRVGLHPNTARFHLDALVEAGLADRAAEERRRPGRPRALYSARTGDGPRSYRLLARSSAATSPPPRRGLRRPP